MKTRNHYFIAHFVTDLGFVDDEYEMFYAPTKAAVEQEIKNALNEHLLACEVRRATIIEIIRFKRTKANPCIVH